MGRRRPVEYGPHRVGPSLRGALLSPVQPVGGRVTRGDQLDPEAIVALGYVGLLAGAVAYIAYFGLLDAAGAIRANLVFYLVPVVAAVGGWALLGETISTLAVVGFLTIFVGFGVIGSESVDLPTVRHRLANRTPDRLDTGAEEPRGFEAD
ncbi:EamA family transporter [Haloplanus litoreus]|uniref:EamA family transporter n=1 Tax=Haloplanus litoreus TaxID=767515 RepID=UPI0036107039